VVFTLRALRLKPAPQFWRLLLPPAAVQMALNPQQRVMSVSQAPVETVSTGAEKAKLAGSAALLVAGFVAFYALGKQDAWVRWLALLALFAAAVALFFVSEPGKQLLAFGRDAVRETRKVVWPTRKEAMQMTGYVFAFVFVMALFMWITDKTLEWVLYDLILNLRG
jgi:preprotein translocase subunit SecE